MGASATKQALLQKNSHYSSPQVEPRKNGAPGYINFPTSPTHAGMRNNEKQSVREIITHDFGLHQSNHLMAGANTLSNMSAAQAHHNFPVSRLLKNN